MIAKGQAFVAGLSALITDPNDDVDAVRAGTGRWYGQLLNDRIRGREINQHAIVDIIEVVMPRGIGVIEHPRRVNAHFPNQAALGEQS